MKLQKRMKRQKLALLPVLTLLISPLFILSSCNNSKPAKTITTKTTAATKLQLDSQTQHSPLIDQVQVAVTKAPSTIERLLSLQVICEAKEFNWSSIEIISSLEKQNIECMVRADERLSSFTPFILYAHGPVEIRRVKKGREFFFKKGLTPTGIEIVNPKEAAQVFLQVRADIKKQMPLAKMELVTSDDESGSSALRISSGDPTKVISFINSLNLHIYRIELIKAADGIKSITVELEVVSSKNKE